MAWRRLLREDIIRAAEVVLCASPWLWPYVESVRDSGANLVFDYLDDYEEFYAGNPNARKYVSGRVRRALETANVTVVTSDYLFWRASGIANRVIKVPNGVRSDWIGKSYEIHDRLRTIPRPRIGFIGAIREWIDVGLIVRTAQEFRHVSFVLAGPILKDLSKFLNRSENIYVIPEVNKDDVPRLITGFDVCICPFAESRLAYGVDPLKVYEYLALGKPVVATGLPELEMLARGGIIYLAKDYREFSQILRKLVSEPEDNRSVVQRRLEYVRTRTWDALAMQLLSRIAQ